MKTVLIIFITSFSLLAFGQESEGCKQIRDAYKLFSKNIYNSEYAELYVSKTPSNFKGFYQIFSNKKGCINDSAFYYVRLLRKARGFIGDEKYFSKIFKVSLGGFYEVDGISALQNLNHYLLKAKNRNSFLNFLDKQDSSDLKQYFKFVFDITKSDLFFEEIRIKEFKSSHPKVYKCANMYVK